MIIIYLLASVCYLTVFFSLLYGLYNKRSVGSASVQQLLLLFGSGLHTWLLLPAIVTNEGLNFNVFNVVSLTCLFLLLFFLLFSLFRSIISLAILAAPTAFMGLTIGFFAKAPYQPISEISTGLKAHILISIAAYSLLLMSSVQAVIVHLQIRELKHQTYNRLWVSKLPPLQTMEQLLFDMLLFGFILLSTALLMGAVYVDNLLSQHLAHKTAFSLLSWVIFANLIYGHWRYGWRGRKAANFTISGFALLALGFIGSKVVLELFL